VAAGVAVRHLAVPPAAAAAVAAHATPALLAVVARSPVSMDTKVILCTRARVYVCVCVSYVRAQQCSAPELVAVAAVDVSLLPGAG